MFVGKRKAEVWRYFKDDNPPHREKARCAIAGCNKLVPCNNGGSSNAMNHLRVHHPLQHSSLIHAKLQANKRSVDEAYNDESALDDDLEVIAECSRKDGEPEPLSPAPSTSSLPTSPLPSPGTPMSPPPPSPLPRSVQTKLDDYKPLDTKTQEKCHMAVSYYVATCMRPLNTVEKGGFKVLCSTLNPRYKPLSRRTLTRTYIPKLYEATRENISHLLKQAGSLALTTDIWTSVAHDSYMSLTGHFVSESWDLVNITLACKMIEENHTGEYLKEVMLKMLQDWELSHDTMVSGVTSDNGENIRCALELLGMAHIHMRCVGHTINNGVSAVVSNCQGLQKSLSKARSARSWLCSDKVWRAYEKHVQGKHHKTPKRIPAPCQTRWWIDLSIAEAIVGQYQWMWGFATSYSKGKFFDEIPSRDDIGVLKAYVKALKPVEKISSLLCGDKYVTASMVLPMTYILDPGSLFYAGEELTLTKSSFPQWESEENEDEAEDEEDDDDIPLSDYESLQPKAIHGAIAAKLNKRFNPPVPSPNDTRARNEYTRGVACNQLLRKCSYLDPRFRSQTMEADCASAKEQLLEELLQSSTRSEQTPPADLQQKTALTTAASALMSVFKKRRLQPEGEGAPETDPSAITKKSFEREVAIYEGFPEVELTEDAFKWWQRHSGSLPLLSRLARRYLVIAASSLSSERLFSTGGNVITDTRTALTGENAEKLIFISQNEAFVPLPK